MPSAEVTRSDSNRSDASLKPRVSFNRDVHVKRIVPHEDSRVTGAVTGVSGETVITSPVRKQRLKRSKKELAEEAAKVLRQADKVGCIADNRADKFYTLPSRKKNREPTKDYPSYSLDRRSNKRKGSLELVPPKKPPRTFANASSASSKPSIFDIFKKTEKKAEPKKSNLRRSVSDASALRSQAFGPVESGPKVKRSGSYSEERKRLNTKKQLSPIIEVNQREDYFSPTDKENISVNLPQIPEPQKEKRSESVTEQLKEYIDEVDEELYRETGIRITSTPIKEPTPIIIDLDKAENISNPKKAKLNFGLGKKLKSLTQKKAKANDGVVAPKNESAPEFICANTESNGIDSDIKTKNEDLEGLLSSSPVAPIIQNKIEELENFGKKSPSIMIHSSQKPAEKPPLTKGKTVNTMVKRLSHDSCSSPPPTRTDVLIMPNVTVQHNNNQPFSYTRGYSPDKYRSNEDLPRDLPPNPTKPIIYAQVVCGANGLSNGKQTIHTTYHGRRQQHSDSDEGLGGEDSLGFNRKYESEKTVTHFGDERFESYNSETEKLLDEIDKYKAESPIMPKYRSPAHNGFSGIMERGRGDGMDAKRRESLTEHDNGFISVLPGSRADLSTRRDLLESRMNRRMTDSNATPSPEYHPKKTSANNVYVSETSSKYYRSGSTSPVGYKEKYISETKKDRFGERHMESRSKKYFGDPNSSAMRISSFDNEPKSLESQNSDYRSSPENHRFKSSHNVSSNTRKPTKLVKDREVYKSTPEIHQNAYFHNKTQHSAYHDSLPREEKIQSFTSNSQRFQSERFLDREGSDRRTEKFADSGIENDFRRESSENYKPVRPPRNRRDLYNESEDEGFASSLLIASEKQHTDSSLARKSRKDYDSDRPSSRNDLFRYSDNRYIPRERSIDDGSHFDPRLDKEVERSTLKRTEKKPPKPEKKSGLGKVKSLFMRDNKKKKEKISSTTEKSNGKYHKKEENDKDSNIRSTPDYRNRRRLSTPSPERDIRKNSKTPSSNGGWFKSLDRLTRRKPQDKQEKESHFTSTEDETIISPSKLSSSTNNLRFFGDTDQESNADSVRGLKSRKRPGLRSQSTRDLHNISEELHKNARTTERKHHKSLTNISETERDLKGSRTNLKPPQSPSTPSSRYRPELNHREDRVRRRKRHDISSVESSTEGDSSQQSQRSIVYLHAATVGDIPGPEYLRSGRKAASREDLTSNHSSFIQPQVKTLSRSFSVLAPWRPRHPREGMDIDYTQYQKSGKGGKYEQKSGRNVSSRNDNSTLKKKTQDSKRNQQLLSRTSRSKENLSSSTLRQSKEELSRGSTSTLYKKKEKMPRENSRYTRDRGEDRKLSTKSQSVESITRKSRGDSRDVARSVSMPRDTGKTAGWFRKTKKPSNNQRL